MNMRELIERTIKSITIFDIGILKLLLFVAGLIVGAYYYEFVLKYAWYFQLAFIVLLALMLYRVFKK